MTERESENEYEKSWSLVPLCLSLILSLCLYDRERHREAQRNTERDTERHRETQKNRTKEEERREERGRGEKTKGKSPLSPCAGCSRKLLGTEDHPSPAAHHLHNPHVRRTTHHQPHVTWPWNVASLLMLGHKSGNLHMAH